MTSDASLPPNAPMTTTIEDSATVFGLQTTSGANGHGEADASQTSPLPSSPTLQQTCADIHDRVSRFLAAEPKTETLRRTQEQTRIALSVIDQALKRYEFKTLSLSYNGGKDCLVLLIIYLSALHTYFTSRTPPTPSPSQSQSQSEGQPKSSSSSVISDPAIMAATTERSEKKAPNSQSFPTSIPSIYAKPPDPFPQVSSFVTTSTRQYHLDLTHTSTNPGPQSKFRSHVHPAIPSSTTDTVTTPNGTHEAPVVTFRDAFALYLKARPSVQAIFVGTRRTDPHGGKLTHFDMTDGNWPRFMRIHPVIDWRLCEIWTFLRHPCLKEPSTGAPLEYCSMYDQGYTSLGGVNDTIKNPRLKTIDEHGKEIYRPAYELTDDDGERLGRE